MKKQLLSLVTLMTLCTVLITPSITQAEMTTQYNIDTLSSDLDTSDNTSLDGIGNPIQDPDAITQENIEYLLNQTNDDIQDAIDMSHADFPSAPITYEPEEVIEYSPWEQIHRQAMLQGFEWIGEIAQYVAPKMYIGTTLTSPYNSEDMLADMTEIDMAIELSSASTEEYDTEDESYNLDIADIEDTTTTWNEYNY
jgi:hypothetical protein